MAETLISEKKQRDKRIVKGVLTFIIGYISFSMFQS